MKRVLIIGAVGIALVAMLVVGFAFGLAAVPVRAGVSRALSRVLQVQPVQAAAQVQSTNLQLKDEKGILVAGVFAGSPADKAGLVRGDILLKADGQDINTRTDLNGVLATHKVGDSLALVVQHGDQQKTVNVMLAAPQVAAPAAPATPQSGTNNNATPAPNGNAARQAYPFLGIVPLGVNEGKVGMPGKGVPGKGQAGAVIVQVATGSPAEKAGLKAGETITAVNGTTINAQNNLSTLLAKRKPGDSVKLQVTGTDGASREVTVALGDNPQKAGTAYLGVSVASFHGRGFDWMMPGLPGNPNNANPNATPGPNGPQNGMPFRFHNNPNLAGHQGALIGQVTAGSPAEKAGLKSGQLIEAVDGKKLTSETALSDAISAHKSGDKVTLSVFDPQANKTSDVQVTLGDNPQKAGTAWLGISYGYINPQPGSGTQL